MERKTEAKKAENQVAKDVTELLSVETLKLKKRGKSRMHLIVVIQEALPALKSEGPIGDFVKKVSSKQYSVPFVSAPWAKIRAREIRFYDFIIPEAIESEVLQDLVPYNGSKINKLSKIASIPILSGIIQKTLGIEPVDMDKYRAIVNASSEKKGYDAPIYISILGKVADGYTEDGMELL